MVKPSSSPRVTSLRSLFLPKSYKPIDFWYGTWTLRHNPVRGWRKPTTLTLSAGERANTLSLSSPSTESATRWCFPMMLPRVRLASRDRLCTTRRIDMLVVSSSYQHHWLMGASSLAAELHSITSLGMKISSKPSLRVPSSPMVRSTPSMVSPT